MEKSNPSSDSKSTPNEIPNTELPPSYSGTSTHPVDEKHAPPSYDSHLGETQPGRKSSSAATPLQTVDFKYHGALMQRMSINDVDNSSEVFDVDLRMMKPHMIFYAAVEDSALPLPSEAPKKHGLFSRFRSKEGSSMRDGKMAIAEADFHATTRRIDCTIRGNKTSLKPGKWLQEQFTYTSAVSGTVRQWKNLNGWRSLDMICVEEDTEGDPEIEAQKTGGKSKKPENGVIVARLRIDNWYKMKLGSLELFDNSSIPTTTEKGTDVSHAQPMSPAELEELMILGVVLSCYKLMYLSQTMVPLAAGASAAAT